MSTRKQGAKQQPFPGRRPPIRIAPSQAKPYQARVVIDGVVFVHWYDCLTGLACGL